MAVVTITNDNFETEVLASQTPVILDFWAEWCGPCRMQSPIFDELAEELSDSVKFGKVNIDEQQALAAQHQVMTIPTLMIFKDGALKAKKVGLQDKDELLAFIKSC
ncbi:MAG: thioredoxin [Roseburia sp.]